MKSLIAFKAQLLGELHHDDVIFEVFDKEDRSTWDPYSPEVREKLRQVVKAGTDVEQMIVTLSGQFPDYWNEQGLRERAYYTYSEYRKLAFDMALDLNDLIDGDDDGLVSVLGPIRDFLRRQPG